MTSLEALERITPTLPTFPPAIDEGSGFKEHKMICGHSFSWCLDSRPEGSCARWFNTSGTDFPEHVHIEREWIIIIKGSMELTTSEGIQELGVGDWWVLEPNELHGARFLEDCFYYAITIPRSPDWPVCPTK